MLCKPWTQRLSALLALENCLTALGDLLIKITEFPRQASEKINLTEYSLDEQGSPCFSLK